MATSVNTRTTAQTGSVEAFFSLSIERQSIPVIGDLSEADAAWPHRLRQIARASLAYWGQPDLIETAELLLTELLTNALQHGHSNVIGVRLSLRDAHCVIEVSDGSPNRPRLCHARPTDEGGRGLFLVDALTESWGVSPDGTTTWCSLHLNEGPTPCDPSR